MCDHDDAPRAVRADEGVETTTEEIEVFRELVGQREWFDASRHRHEVGAGAGVEVNSDELLKMAVPSAATRVITTVSGRAISQGSSATYAAADGIAAYNRTVKSGRRECACVR